MLLLVPGSTEPSNESVYFHHQIEVNVLCKEAKLPRASSQRLSSFYPGSSSLYDQRPLLPTLCSCSRRRRAAEPRACTRGSVLFVSVTPEVRQA